MAKRNRNQRRARNAAIIGNKTAYHSIVPKMHEELRNDTDDSTPDLYEMQAILGSNEVPTSPDGTYNATKLLALWTGKIDADFLTAVIAEGLAHDLGGFLNTLWRREGSGGGGVAALVPSVQYIEGLMALDISDDEAYPHLSIIAVRDGNGLGIYYIWRDNEEEETTDTTYYTVVRDISDTHTFFKLTNFPARLTKGATAPFELLEELYNWYGNNFPYLREPHMQAIVGGEPEYPYLRLYPFPDEPLAGNHTLVLQHGSKGFIFNYELDKLSIVNLDTYAAEEFVTLPSKMRTAKISPDKSTIVMVGQDGNVYTIGSASLAIVPTNPGVTAFDVVTTNEWVFYCRDGNANIGYFSLTSFGGHTTITLAHSAAHLLLTDDLTGIYAIGSNGVSYIDVATKAVTQLVNSGSFVTFGTQSTFPFYFRKAAISATHFFVLARTAALNQYNVLRFLRSDHSYVGATVGNFDAVFANPETEDAFVYTSSGTTLQKLNSDFSLSASLNIDTVTYPGFFHEGNLYVGNSISRKIITPAHVIESSIFVEGENWWKDESKNFAYAGYPLPGDLPNKLKLSFIDLDKNEAISISENGVYQLTADLSFWLKQTSRTGASTTSTPTGSYNDAELRNRIEELETSKEAQQVTIDNQQDQIDDLTVSGLGLETFPIQNGLTVGKLYYKTSDSVFVQASPATEGTAKVRGLIVGSTGGNLIGRLSGTSLTSAELTALSLNSYDSYYLGGSGAPELSPPTTPGHFMKVVLRQGNLTDETPTEIGLEDYLSVEVNAAGTDVVPDYASRLTVTGNNASAFARTPSLVGITDGKKLSYINKGAGVMTITGTFSSVTDPTLDQHESIDLEFFDGAYYIKSRFTI